MGLSQNENQMIHSPTPLEGARRAQFSTRNTVNQGLPQDNNICQDSNNILFTMMQQEHMMSQEENMMSQEEQGDQSAKNRKMLRWESMEWVLDEWSRTAARILQEFQENPDLLVRPKDSYNPESESDHPQSKDGMRDSMKDCCTAEQRTTTQVPQDSTDSSFSEKTSATTARTTL